MARLRDMLVAAILVLFFTEGTFSSGLVKEIDLFKEVGLISGQQFTGISLTTGQHGKSAAFHFTTKTSHLIANQKAYEDADNVIHNSHDFWVSAWAKIDANARYQNPIVSISSKDGNQLFFLLKISGKPKGTGLDIDVTVHDKAERPMICEASSDSDSYVNYTAWNEIAVRFQDNQSLVRIFLNNKLVKVKRFFGFDSFPADAQLHLAQLFEVELESTGSISERFKGDLQDVKFRLGTQCLEDCPPPKGCKYEDVVGVKHCVMEGFRYEDGSRWKKNKCTICDCKWGQVICTHTCAVCKDDGKTYLHGDTWKSSNDSCLTCRCEEGKSVCSPPFCPTPDCSGKSGDLVIPKGKCCKVCKEDQCEGTGKEYKPCGCNVTCDNYQSFLNQGRKCQSCTEGCFCPDGQVLHENGECGSTIRCPCIHQGKRYEPLDYEMTGCQYCMCLSGDMKCLNLCTK